MEIVEDPNSLRERIASCRAEGAGVALVPTMGNLHQGHLELVRRAAREDRRTVVSIFVNPLQFGAGEDFDSYPRTFDEDARQLDGLNVDLLFCPRVETLYPVGQEQQTRVEVPGVSDILCGASRPGHFVGVATVVCKLFNLVQPDIAVFGEKDFQQLAVIRRMVEELAIPVEVIGVPTVRETDGLAMSSRNGYLSAEQRVRAPQLYRTLCWIAERIRADGETLESLEAAGGERLRAEGFEPEYVTVLRASDLSRPGSDDAEMVVLAAARLGRARLIDNVRACRA